MVGAALAPVTSMLAMHVRSLGTVSLVRVPEARLLPARGTISPPRGPIARRDPVIRDRNAEQRYRHQLGSECEPRPTVAGRHVPVVVREGIVSPRVEEVIAVDAWRV